MNDNALPPGEEPQRPPLRNEAASASASEAAQPQRMKNREQRAGLVVGGIIVFFVLAALGVFLANQSRALAYTLYFKDAEGLTQGDRVMMSGVAIGVVKRVKLQPEPGRVDVLVRIDPEFAQRIRADSTAKIRDVSWPNVSGQMIVEILNPRSGPESPPMEDGATKPGLNGVADEMKWRIRNKFSSLPQTFAEARTAWAAKSEDLKKNLKLGAEELQEKYEVVKNDPHIRELIAKLLAFLEEMKVKGVAGVRELARKWPAIKAQVDPAIARLREFGAESTILKLRRLTEDVDRTLILWQDLSVEEDGSPAAAPAAEDAATTQPTRNQP